MNWKKINTFVCIQSPWLTLIGEKWQDEKQQIVDYWRVEKDDSVIIIPLYRHQFILPQPMFRPGLGKTTLDFPGGRLPKNKKPLSIVPEILQRELSIPKTAILSIDPINQVGYPVNSSFSNQKLYGFRAIIDHQWEGLSKKQCEVYKDTDEDRKRLLEVLTCLQCRSLFLEFLHNN